MKRNDIPKEYFEMTKEQIRNACIQVLATRQTGCTKVCANMLDRYLRANYYIYSIRQDETPELWIYKNGIYVPNGKSYIKEEIKEILRSFYTAQISNDTIERILASTFIEQDEFFKHADIDKVAILNGIFDISKTELMEFTPTLRFFNKIKAKYNPNAECPIFLDFLSDIISKEDIPVIQEMFGWVLRRDYKIPKAILLVGGGRNGKSTLLNILKLLIGIENCSSISLQQLCHQRFAVCELHHKLANICGDLSDKSIKEKGMFKQLTGGDPIQADRKFKRPVKFTNYAKLIFSTNKPPTVYNADEAFYARWVIVNFPYRFYSEREIETMEDGDEDVSDVKIADRNVISKIFPAESSGIFKWAIDGLDRLEKNKTFTKSVSAKKLEEEYLRLSDSFAYFCEMFIEKGVYNLDTIVKQKLREEYNKFCHKYRCPPLSDRHIKTVLGNRFWVTEKQNTEGKNVWNGIKIKSQELQKKLNG